MRKAHYLVGGATTSYDPDGFHLYNKREVHAQDGFGRVLIFQHRDVLHSGQEIENGVKVPCRPTVMEI